MTACRAGHPPSCSAPPHHCRSTASLPNHLPATGPNFPVVAEYPAKVPAGFNPHGIAIDAARQKLVTAEYLEYK